MIAALAYGTTGLREAHAAPGDAPGDAAPGETVAEEEKPTLTWHGRLFSYVRAPLRDPLDTRLQQVSSSAWLELRGRASDSASGTAVASIDALTPGIDGSVELRGRLREAYGLLRHGGVELRVGQQIIPWGNADGVHAIDFLTAYDNTFFAADSDVRQVGAPSAQLSATTAGETQLSATLVWTPVFPASKVIVPEGLLPEGVTLLPATRPDMTLRNSEVAGKVRVARGGFDLSAVAFYGFNHVAEAYPVSVGPGPDGVDNGIVIGRAFRRYAALGLESSATLGPWVVRVEAAYVATQNASGKNPLVQPSFIDAVAGIERAFGERVRASAQGIVRSYPQWASPEQMPDRTPEELAQREAARANSVLLNYTHQVRPGATLRIAYTSESEVFEADVVGLVYLVGTDFFLRPSVAVRVADALKLHAGLELFGGQRNSIGALYRYSGAFFQASYAF